jgi:hypothetical protein
MPKVKGGKLVSITYDNIPIDPEYIQNFELDAPPVTASDGYEGSITRAVCIAEIVTMDSGETTVQVKTCTERNQVLLAIMLLNARLEVLKRQDAN